MPSFFRLRLGLCLLLSALPVCAPAQNAPHDSPAPNSSALERLRHAYALTNVGAMRASLIAHGIVTSRVEALLPVHNTFHLVAYLQGERVYEKITLGGIVQEQCYDLNQNRGWERRAGMVNDMPPADMVAARQGMVHSIRLLTLLDRPGAQASDLGLCLLPDKSRARRLRFTPPLENTPGQPSNNVPTDFYLEPTTDRLRAFGYRDRDPRRGIPTDMLTVITAWLPPEPAHPFPYPRQSSLYENGALTERITTEKIDCGTPIENARFDRPVEADRFSPASRFPSRTVVNFARGYAVVPVRVNSDRRPGYFLLDTGADSSSVGAALARRLKLPLGETMSNYSGLGNFASRASRVRSLRVGSAEVRDMALDVMRDETLAPLREAVGGPVDGILGNDFLRAFQVTLDYNGPTLILDRPNAPLPSGTRVTFFISGGAPTTTARIAGGPEMAMTLDTGAPTTWLPPRYVELLPSDRQANWVGFHGERDGTRLVWLPEIRLSAIPPPAETTSSASSSNTSPAHEPTEDVTLRDQVAWSVATPRTARPTGSLLADEYEGLYGSDLMRHFRITFDYRRSVLVFNRLPRPALARFDTVGIGAWTTWRGQSSHTRRLLIRTVWPFSPAAQAGLKAGDELLEIQGSPVRVLSENAIAGRLWYGKEEETVRLRVRQRGEIHTLELKRRRLF